MEMTVSAQATQGRSPVKSVTLRVMSALHMFITFSFDVLETGKQLLVVNT